MPQRLHKAIILIAFGHLRFEYEWTLITDEAANISNTYMPL